MRNSLLLPLVFLLACSGGETETRPAPVSSRSYTGHASESDTDTLVAVYPSLAGTRLDDCQTCHTGTLEEGRRVASSCDHCHALLLEGTAGSPLETLNPFGRDYLDAGRRGKALRNIGEMDSDGDGYTNAVELAQGRDPGNARSRPGQLQAPLLTLSLGELKQLPVHQEFLLVNTTQQRFNDYATFRGIRVRELLESQGVDLTGASGITVFAPDGYRKSIPLDQVMEPFPQPVFHSGLGVESLGEDCGFVQYPESRPEGVRDGAPIPGELWLLLAWERNGEALEPATLDVARGTLRGEGPLRLVVPEARPGVPDRGSDYSPSGCGDAFDFRDHADHNAGAMVRGVVAIRVDPMPAGLEEPDLINEGWALVDAGQLILYGHGIGN